MKDFNLFLPMFLAYLAICSPFSQLDPGVLVGYGNDNPLGVTTGGEGGDTVTIDNVEALAAAISDNKPRVILVNGSFNLTSRLKMGSNKSLIGIGDTASFNNSGITISSVTNVIIRNLKISYVYGNDGITIQNSTRVWIDHNEFSSDINHGPDQYDGQLDTVRASDWVAVSWNYFHDHWKSSLHVYNNYYEDYLYQAIHSRSDNQVLVEGNVFTGNTSEALSTYGLVIPEDSPNTCTCGDEELDGFANLGAENDFGSAGVNITRTGNFTKVDYDYTLTPHGMVKSVVVAGAGVGKIEV
ncbi:pectin lyase fold/virulence factor [Hypoxylon argillaceum]|nr:pectin lyase fold/virulence factor [Hypoxylon argillaceum]